MAYWLSMCKLVHHLLWVDCNVTDGVQNFPDDWEYNEFNAFFVWMILEHMDCGKHSSLHWRGEHCLPLDFINAVLMRLALEHTYWMELRVFAVWVGLNSFELW